jgi:thiamine-phosphate diphosphorylase
MPPSGTTRRTPRGGELVVSFPRLLVLTDRRAGAVRGRVLTATVAAAVDAGAPAIVLRERDLPRVHRRALAADLRGITAAAGTWLIVAGDPELATEVGADGVHLAGRDPLALAAGMVTGRSCHDADEVAAARAAGVDLVTLSPVAPTASKPGYGPALGADGLAALAAAAVPSTVYALGGVTPDDVPRWRASGAHGVAVMGPVMRAADPATIVRRYLARLQEVTP